jgi:subfamily B ATP-binding cassette protein MsbA
VTLLLLSAATPVIQSYSLQSVINALAALDLKPFLLGAVLLAASFGLDACLSGAGVWYRTGIIESLSMKQRGRFVEAVLRMPLLHLEQKPRGDLATRITADVSEASRAFTNAYFVAEIVLRAASALAYMLFLNWRVGLASALTGPIAILITGVLASPVTSKAKALQDSLGEVSSYAVNVLEGLPVVKAYCAEDGMKGSFSAKARRVFTRGLDVGRQTAYSVAWSSLASFLPFAVTFVYGGYMVLAGELTPGGVFALVNLCNNLSWPIASLATYWTGLNRSMGSLHRVLEVTREPADGEGDVGALSYPGEETSGRTDRPFVEVRHLSFEYVPGVPVLKDVSMTISKGAKVAIVGRSGCGKSTLLKVLAGLYPPAPGTVFIGDEDMFRHRLSSIRKRVTLVTQEPFLFAATVRDNLALGRRDASDEAMEGALTAADAAGFVKDMPGELDADISERGGSLSGGQRQRLTIARALLRECDLLLMDEPTSALDQESESNVWRTLMELMADKTWVVITHRFEAAEQCDTVIVMDAGRIVDMGRHQDLVARPGLYRSLYTGELSFKPGTAATEAGETQ